MTTEKLYNKFVAEMDQPLSSRYYEEDELLDIFDYASDMADDAVRMEVVLLAQRLCPQSTAMAERKAMLYWSMGNDKAALKTLRKISGRRNNFLSRLTELRIEKGKNGVGEEDLSNLLKGVKKESLPDEEVIQLIETAEDSGRHQWLIDNYDLLKEVAMYPETLMYDLVEPMLEWVGTEDYEFVNRLLDDLTMASPYDLGYWEYAAMVALNHENDPERALGYVEYALAIDPKSVKALTVKCDSLLRGEKPDLDGAVAAGRDAYSNAPTDYGACLVYARALHAAGRKEDALGVLDKYLATPGCDADALVIMTAIDKEMDVYTRLKEVMGNIADGSRETQLDAVLSKLVEGGNYEHVAQVLMVAEELGFNRNYKPEFIVEVYFRTGRFERILPHLPECQPFDHRTWMLALLLSLPPLDKNSALGMIDDRMEQIERSMRTGSLSQVLEAKSIKDILMEVRRCVAEEREVNPEKFSLFFDGEPQK